MSNNDSHQDSSVENENKNENESEDEDKSEDDSHVSSEVLAESIRNKTDALHAQGSELADQLERMAEAEDEEDEEVDPTAMMTELLETASDLIEVAHAIEDVRVQDGSE